MGNLLEAIRMEVAFRLWFSSRFYDTPDAQAAAFDLAYDDEPKLRHGFRSVFLIQGLEAGQ